MKLFIGVFVLVLVLLISATFFFYKPLTQRFGLFNESTNTKQQSYSIKSLQPIKSLNSDKETKIIKIGEFIEGKSSPLATIVIFLSPGDIEKETKADKLGNWSIEIDPGIKEGPYRLDFKELNEDNSIKSFESYRIKVISSAKPVSNLFAIKEAKAQENDPKFQQWHDFLGTLGVKVVKDTSGEILFYDSTYYCQNIATCPTQPTPVDLNTFRRNFQSNTQLFQDLRVALYERCYHPDNALSPYFPEIVNFPIQVPWIANRSKCPNGFTDSEIDANELEAIFTNLEEELMRSDPDRARGNQFFFDTGDFFFGTRALLTLAIKPQEELNNEEYFNGVLAIAAVTPPGKPLKYIKNGVARISVAAKDFGGIFKTRLKSPAGLPLKPVVDQAERRVWVVRDDLVVKRGTTIIQPLPKQYPAESEALWRKLADKTGLHGDLTFSIPYRVTKPILDKVVAHIERFHKLPLSEGEIYEGAEKGWIVLTEFPLSVFYEDLIKIEGLSEGRTILMGGGMGNSSFIFNEGTLAHEFIHYLGSRIQKKVYAYYKLESRADLNLGGYSDRIHLIMEMSTDLLSKDITGKPSVFVKKFPQVHDSMEKVIAYLQKYSNGNLTMEDFYKFALDADDEILLKKIFNTDAISQSHIDAFLKMMGEELDDSKIRELLQLTSAISYKQNNNENEAVLGVTSSINRMRVSPPMYSKDLDILNPDFRQKGAEAYFIRPIILVPNNAPVDESENYKSAVLDSLRQVQAFYKNKSRGVTFRFENEVKVIRSSRDGNSDATQNTQAMFEQLDGYGLLPEAPELTYAVFIAESGNISNSADDTKYPKTKYAFLNDETLKDLTGDSETRNDTLGEIAHQLGHAFGLDEPCAHGHVENCGNKDGIYPPEEDFTDSIMGSAANEYPDVDFNNSPDNPEIKTLYDNRFTNPFYANSPIAIQDDSVPASQTEIQLSGNQASKGNTITITSSGLFGPAPGQINLYLVANDTVYHDQKRAGFTVGDWTENSIPITITEADEFDSYWEVEVVTAAGTKYTTTPAQQLLIKSITATSPLGTINYQTNCTNALLKLVRTPLNSSSGIELQRIGVRFDGKGQILFNPSEHGDGKYTLVAEPLGSIRAVPEVVSILNRAPTVDFTVSAVFTYPSCPAGQPINGNDPKRITSIKINNRTLLSADVAGLSLNLRDFGGVEGQAKVITVPVTYTYTDGSTEQKTITFNYNGGSSGGTACVNEEWKEVSGQFTCTGCGQAKRKEKKYCNGVATTETRTRSYEQRKSDCNTAQYCTRSCNRGTPYQLFDGRKYDCSDGGGEKCSGGFYDMNNICAFGARCEKLFCNCDYRENTDNTDNCDDGKVRVRVCKGGDPRHTTETGSDTDDGCGYRQEVPPACRLTNECNTP